MSRAKLTDKQVKQVFKLSKKMTQTEIAVKFDVTQATISYILSRKKYREVEI